MPELLKDIEAAEAKLNQLKTLLQDTKKKFLANDGVIDKDEQVQINSIEANLKVAEKKIKDSWDEYAKHETLWKAKSGELTILKLQSAQLKDWDHSATASIEKSIAEITKFEGKGAWKKAVDTLELAQKQAKSPIDQVKAQVPKKLEFQAEMKSFVERYNKAKSSEYFSAAPVQSLIAPVDAAVANADKSESDRKYDQGLNDLQAANKALSTLNDKIRELKTDFDIYTANRDAMNQGLDRISKHPHQSDIVKGAVSSIKANLPAIDAEAGAHNYGTAVDLLNVSFKELDKAEKDIEKNSPEGEPKRDVYDLFGELIALTDEEFKIAKVELCTALKQGPLFSMENALKTVQGTHAHYKALNKKEWAAWFIVALAGGFATLPHYESFIQPAQDAYDVAKSVIEANDITGAEGAFKDLEKELQVAVGVMQQYQRKMFAGGELAITVLQVTQTTAFAVVGVLAAPVATGVLVSAGVSGTAAAYGGAMIGSAAGVALDGYYKEAINSKFDSRWKQDEAFQRVATDAGVAAITAGVAKGSGDIAKEMESRFATRLARTEVFKDLSEGARNAFAKSLMEGSKSSLEAAIKSVGEAIKPDKSMTAAEFFERVTSAFITGALLAPFGTRIEKYSSGNFDNLSEAFKADSIIYAKTTAKEDIIKKLKKEGSTINKAIISSEVDKKIKELAPKIYGDAMKKASKGATNAAFAAMTGNADPNSLDRLIRDKLPLENELKKARDDLVNQAVKEVEKELANKKEAG